MKQGTRASDLKHLYDEAYAHRLLAREETRRIRPILAHVVLDAHTRILDVGCGNGPLAGLISPRIGEYHGVDFSDAFIQSARRISNERGLVNCHFHCADVVEFVSRHQNQFDVVFALDISEHVPDADWQAIVASFKQALKPGGKVILHTPNLDFFIERMKESGVLLKQFREHVAVRTAAQNMAFFEHTGFSSVEVRYLPHYNFLRVLHPLTRLPGIRRFFAARILLIATR